MAPKKKHRYMASLMPLPMKMMTKGLSEKAAVRPRHPAARGAPLDERSKEVPGGPGAEDGRHEHAGIPVLDQPGRDGSSRISGISRSVGSGPQTQPSAPEVGVGPVDHHAGGGRPAQGVADQDVDVDEIARRWPRRRARARRATGGPGAWPSRRRSARARRPSACADSAARPGSRTSPGGCVRAGWSCVGRRLVQAVRRLLPVGRLGDELDAGLGGRHGHQHPVDGEEQRGPADNGRPRARSWPGC